MSERSSPMVQDESLSALMDGEAHELELRRLLQRLPDDPDLRARWARYQLASSILHKQQYLPVALLGIADAVQVAIQKDSSFEQDLREPQGAAVVGAGWRKGVARFAVAASVALAVVASVQWQRHMSSAVQLAAAIPATDNQGGAVILEPVAAIPLMANKPFAAGASVLAKDKQYMQYNLEHASLEAGGGIIPLAPVADRINQRK